MENDLSAYRLDCVHFPGQVKRPGRGQADPRGYGTLGCQRSRRIRRTDSSLLKTCSSASRQTPQDVPHRESNMSVFDSWGEPQGGGEHKSAGGEKRYTDVLNANLRMEFAPKPLQRAGRRETASTCAAALSPWGRPRACAHSNASVPRQGEGHKWRCSRTHS